MAFKKKTEEFGSIVGFWTRDSGEVLQGHLMAKVSREPSDFFVIRLSKDGGTVNDQQNGKFAGQRGMLVGVSASGVLTRALDEYVSGSRVKKIEVRLTSAGKRSLSSGNTLWDMEVEVDESSIYKGNGTSVAKTDKQDGDIPF